MNPKIQKVIGDIEKTKAKITEFNSRLKELERYKAELENADIVALVRGIDVHPGELEAFLRSFVEQMKTSALPDRLSFKDGKTSSDAKEDSDNEK